MYTPTHTYTHRHTSYCRIITACYIKGTFVLVDLRVSFGFQRQNKAWLLILFGSSLHLNTSPHKKKYVHRTIVACLLCALEISHTDNGFHNKAKSKLVRSLARQCNPWKLQRFVAEFCFEHLRCLLSASVLLAHIVKYNKCQTAVWLQIRTVQPVRVT